MSRTVLHVLPHPGAGGEAYVDALSEMGGYRFDRIWLAPSARPAGSVRPVVENSVRVLRRAQFHDVLHVHGEVASTLCLPSLRSRPSVVTLHGLHLVRRLRGAARAAAALNLRLVLRAASRTICVSHAERAHVVALLGEGAARRAVVIENGVKPARLPSPEERAAARAELGLSPSEVACAWVASLDEHKDPLSVIRAATAARHDGAPLVLLVAGAGPLRPAVEEVARASDAVRVLGFCRDVRRILVAADFFVLSSLREGMSLALLEAMSLGLPAVVSDEPANAEAVGETGLVVSFGDVEGFARAFARLAVDEMERRRLSQQARDRVDERFRFDEMLRRTRDLYDELSG